MSNKNLNFFAIKHPIGGGQQQNLGYLGAQSSYVVKYFEGSNAVNAELDHNTPFFGCTLLSSLEHLILVHLIMNGKDIL